MEHDKMIERKLVALMLFQEEELTFSYLPGGKCPDDWPTQYWNGIREKFKQTAELTETELRIVDETLFKYGIGLYDSKVETYL